MNECGFWVHCEIIKVPFQGIAFSEDDPLLPAWTDSKIVALYITLPKIKGPAFAFCLHCG